MSSEQLSRVFSNHTWTHLPVPVAMDTAGEALGDDSAVIGASAVEVTPCTLVTFAEDDVFTFDVSHNVAAVTASKM